MWTENNTVDQLIEGVLRHGPKILESCQTQEDLSDYLSRIDQERLCYPIPPTNINPTHWFIPREYQSMDIEKFLIENCPEQNRNRLTKELDLFQKYNMIPVLKTSKYIVDTLRKNGIVWGVGRGSSTASYVLHLLGVHKIDSVKYDLPIEEFFKGGENG
jgi:DNA polymerase III alpha subunit